jgi:hypothetical protein
MAFGSVFGGFGPAPGMAQSAPSGGPGVIGGVPPSMPAAGGGFPGIYPGMGPGQSGGAGLVEFLERQRKERPVAVTWGPAAFWLGRR